MQRRSFLAGLLALPAAGVVAREVTRAEPAGAKYAKALARSVRGQLPTYGSQYLTPKDAWYIDMESHTVTWQPVRARYGSSGL